MKNYKIRDFKTNKILSTPEKKDCEEYLKSINSLCLLDYDDLQKFYKIQKEFYSKYNINMTKKTTPYLSNN